jgi:hypothetical protein
MSGIPAWAVRGAKVVCRTPFQHKNGLQRRLAPVLPAPGGIYTIEAVDICSVSGIVDFILVEIETGRFFGEVIAWDASHFGPIVTRSHEQDMAIFRPILDQVPERVG